MATALMQTRSAIVGRCGAGKRVAQRSSFSFDYRATCMSEKSEGRGMGCRRHFCGDQDERRESGGFDDRAMNKKERREAAPAGYQTTHLHLSHPHDCAVRHSAACAQFLQYTFPKLLQVTEDGNVCNRASDDCSLVCELLSWSTRSLI